MPATLRGITPRPTGTLTVKNTYEAGHPIKAILLDGKELGYCVEVNAKEGWVKAIKTGVHGELLVDHDKGEFIYETLHGVVTVEWEDRE